jgi:electron transfer flavoprotein beta subunit
MRIVACVKYSLDVSEIKIDPATKELSLASAPWDLGDIDANVLEAAVTIKEIYGGSAHILSFGPQASRDTLQRAAAMGADDATLVLDPFDGQLNTSGTAEVLMAALERLGACDIVVCGEASDDGASYQVGPLLAGKLGWPQVTYVRSFEVEDGVMVAERDLGESVERVKVRLPVLITVTEETNTPRSPTLMEVLQAKEKPFLEWKLEGDLGLSIEDLQTIPSLELLRTEGVVVERKRILWRDKSATELANQVVDFLVQEGVLEERNP